MDLFETALAPFTIALIVMAGFALLEMIGLIFGAGPGAALDSVMPEMPDMDADLDIDLDADVDADGTLPMALEAPMDGDLGGDPGTFLQFLSWLGVGKVPALIVLVCLLTSFGIAGMTTQYLFHGVAGVYLHPLIAVIGAGALALPVTRYLSTIIGRAFPKEESDAVSVNSHIGKVAIVFRGTAKSGEPAEAKLKDIVGHMHYLLVEPDIEGEEFVEGDEVLLVRKDRVVFKGIRNTQAALSVAH